MNLVGIICEYNPLHNGHRRQIQFLRERYGESGAIVCLMSGNFVQRGQPAIYHKMVRAQAALQAGADLVLELPLTTVLNSAEGFARGGVDLLGGFCDELCFGSESGTAESLMATAQALLSPAFSPALKAHLQKGLSFPAARQHALEDLGLDTATLLRPNDILGVEYCKAILSSGTAMKPLVLSRPGDYHDQTPQPDHPSATALRRCITSGEDLSDYVPPSALPLYAGATVHTLQAGERAILARLRDLSEEEFSQVPFGSEGLWRKLMHESRRQATLEDLIAGVKSKRYTRSRIDRMILCAFLGLTQKDLDTPASYARVLGFTPRGRIALRQGKKAGYFPNIGEKTDLPDQLWEDRAGRMYGLFAQGTPERPDAESTLRVISLSQ